jgi:hypothetical protein
MSFDTGYRGVVGGYVQNNYTDQPGVGIPGMIAFASDLDNVDAVYVGETDGLAAGKGIIYTDVSDDISLQRPNEAAYLPTSSSLAKDFKGITAFDENMQTDENGNPGFAQGRMIRVGKGGRAGCRIYVKANEDINHGSDTVNWVIVAGTNGLYEVGEFSPHPLGGTAENGTSVPLAGIATWITSASAGETAIIELALNKYEP